MRHDGDRAIAQRHQVVVEALQREAMKVREVPGDVQFRHLAFATGKILAPCQPSVEEQQAGIERVP